jgi:nitrogenase subunit NifH
VGISEALNQAQITGKDIFRFEPNGRGAKSYRDLAGEIMALTRKKEVIGAI